MDQGFSWSTGRFEVIGLQMVGRCNPVPKGLSTLDKLRLSVLLATLATVPLAVCHACGSFETLKTTLLILGAGLLLGLWLLDSRPVPDLKRNPTLWTVLGLVLLAVIGAWGKQIDTPPWRGAFYLLCWLLLYLGFWRTWDGRGIHVTVLWVNTVVAAMVAGVALWQIGWSAHSFANSEFKQLPGVATLGNQNFTAAYLMTSFFVALALFRRQRWRTGRGLVAGSLVLAILVGVVLCRSLGGLAGLLAGLLCLAGMWIFRIRGRSPRKGFLVALLLGLTMGTIGLGLVVSDSRWFEGTIPKDPGGWRETLGNSQLEARSREWWICQQMVQDHPWTGVGLNAYKAAWPKYRAIHTRWVLARRDPHLQIPPPDGPRFSRAHNDWYQLLAELGWPGLLVLLAGVGFLTRQFVLSIRAAEPREQEERLYMASGVVALGVLSFVSFPWHLPATSLQGALLFAALCPPGPRPPVTRVGGRGTRLLAGSAAVLVVGAFSWVAWCEFHSQLLFHRGETERLAGHYQDASRLLNQSKNRGIWPDRELAPLGLSLTMAGNLAEAERVLRRALEIEPTYGAYLELAGILSEDGDQDTAKELLKLVSDCYPTRPLRLEVAYNLAVVALRSGRLDQAANQARVLMTLDDESPRTWLVRGVLEQKIGEPTKALLSFQKSADLAHDQLGKIPKETGTWQRLQSEYQAARKSMAEVRAILTGNPKSATESSTPPE